MIFLTASRDKSKRTNKPCACLTNFGKCNSCFSSIHLQLFYLYHQQLRSFTASYLSDCSFLPSELTLLLTFGFKNNLLWDFDCPSTVLHMSTTPVSTAALSVAHL